jgi:hypothetical protein
MTSGEQGKGEISFLAHCRFGEFVDPVHECIHYAQQFGTECIPLQEGMTELFAGILSARIQRRLTEIGHAGLAGKFEYVYNPSYSQGTWLAFDKIVPRMGLSSLAKLYFGSFRDFGLDKSQGMPALEDERKKLLSAHLKGGSAGLSGLEKAISAEKLDGFKTAAELFTAMPPMPVEEAPANMREEYQYARRQFIAWLTSEQKKLQKLAATSIAAIEPAEKRYYLVAKKLRIGRRILAYQIRVDQDEAFRQMELRVHRVDEDKAEFEEKVKNLKRDMDKAEKWDTA